MRQSHVVYILNLLPDSELPVEKIIKAAAPRRKWTNHGLANILSSGFNQQKKRRLRKLVVCSEGTY